MNKNIIILLFITFIVVLTNSYNSYFLILKHSIIYEKTFLTLIFNFFYYNGSFFGVLFFFFIYDKVSTSTILNSCITALIILYFLELTTDDITVLIFIKFLNGFIYSNITNNIELYISKIDKRYMPFFNSITYYSMFTIQSIFNFLPEEILKNEKILILFFFFIFFIKNYLSFVKDYKFEKNNRIDFKELNSLNFLTILMFFFVTFLLTSMCNFITTLFNNDPYSKSITSFIYIGYSISYYLNKYFENTDKKKILMIILTNVFIFSSIVNFILRTRIQNILFFFFSISTFSTYYYSCSIFNKFKKNKNNVILSFLNSFFYSVSPLIVFKLKKADFYIFLIIVKIISFLFFILLYFDII